MARDAARDAACAICGAARSARGAQSA
jgi:hypothetical protein